MSRRTILVVAGGALALTLTLAGLLSSRDGDAEPPDTTVSAGALAAAASTSAPSVRASIAGPTPDATAYAQLSAVIDYYGGNTPEPNFVGTLNGFEFQTNPDPDPSNCGPSNLFGTATDYSQAGLIAPALNFTASDIPTGFQAEIFRPMSSQASGPIAIALCGSEVIQTRQRWTEPDGSISVSRSARPPAVQARYERNRLLEIIVNGRPGIMVIPRFDGEPVYLVLRDDHSVWDIWSDVLDVDSLLRFARGLDG